VVTGTISGSPDSIDTIQSDGKILIATGKQFFGSAPSYVLTSTDGINWKASDVPPTIERVANMDFVAVGPAGWIGTSPDGVAWTTQTSNTMKDLFGIANGGSLTAAVGDVGTILTSPDNGITWTPRTASPPTTSKLLSVWNNGTAFAAVGEGGTIVSSTDGNTWTPRTSGTSATIRDVTARAGTFYAVGDFRTIITSPDGMTWTRTSGYAPVVADFSGVVYGGGKWVALNGSPCKTTCATTCTTVCSSAGVATSTDGVTWAAQTTGSPPPALLAIAYGASTFVAVGLGPTFSLGTLLSSPDAITWTEQGFPGGGGFASLQSVTFGNGTFVAVGGTFTSSAIYTSPDGTTWTQQTSPAGSTAMLESVIFDGTRFVALGNGNVIASSDGVTWTSIATGVSTNVSYLAFGASKYVAVGGSGNSATILTSPDAVTWTPQSATFGPLRSVIFAAGTFVATGNGYNNGTAGILTSPDGITWTPETSQSLNGVGYANSKFVAVGNSSLILSKP
jgi:hypothetical protein